MKIKRPFYPFIAVSLAALLVVGSLTLPASTGTARAQTLQKPDAVALGQAIRKLGTIASALHTGAHPDDEDSGLLAYLALGKSARTAYLALNRGDGGQNIIGAELYDALGVIRTEELLAARRLDGAGQFFTRAYDFGFSKSREEALTKWNQEQALADMVRVIRTFRPLVIIPVFTGTSSDGHGHHQAAGYLTPMAYAYAADPTKFPEQLIEGLRPWQAKKLYLRSGNFQQPRTEPSKEAGVVSINTGEYDALMGRSYYEVAMQGRSQHRSQDQGALETKGARYSFYKIADGSALKPQGDKDLFDGIDVTLTGIAAFAGKAAPQLESRLAEVQSLANAARSKFDPFDPSSVTVSIANGLNKIRELRTLLPGLDLRPAEFYDTDFLLRLKEADFVDALTKAEGIRVDCLAEDEIVSPGQSFNVGISVYRNGALYRYDEATVTNHARPRLLVPQGWSAEYQKSKPQGSHAGEMNFKVTVANDADFSQSYWLKNPRNGDMFNPGKGGTGTEPLAPPSVVAEVELEIGGQMITLRQPVQYRYADKAFGEIRRDLKIAPAVGVTVSPNLLIVPLSNKATEREVSVTVLNNAKEGSKGVVALELPAGWTTTPPQADFNLQREGERASFLFKLKAPPNAAESEKSISAVARVNANDYRQGYQIIAYPHIEPRFLYHPATVRVEMLDVKVAANLRVGYIEGAGDETVAALNRLGIDVHTINARELATGDLSRYDCIVQGIRVYEVRPDVIANNSRLLDYVKNGGTLIVQYNKNEYARGNFAPYMIKMPERGFERVTDEQATVTILEPAHPRFNAPNKITERDFAGWIQERGAYFLTEWDSNFKPMLACHDPGEADKKGGEVIAEYGKGLYVYTAYAWFRQLPTGVPGAYRLFANLISLPKTRALAIGKKK